MKNSIRSIILLLMVTILSTSAFAQDNKQKWKEKLDTEGRKFHVKENLKTGAPHRILGLKHNFNINGSINRNNVEEKITNFLAQNAEIFKVQTKDLKLISAETNKGKWFVSLQQTYKSVPIFKSNVGLTINENGDLLIAGADVYNDINLNVIPKISSDAALSGALRDFKNIPGVNKVDVDYGPELIVFPIEKEESIEYILSWTLKLSNLTDALPSSNTYFISCETGFMVANFSNKSRHHSPSPMESTNNIPVVPTENRFVETGGKLSGSPTNEANFRRATMSGNIDIKYWANDPNSSVLTADMRYGKVRLETIGGSYIGTATANSSGDYSYGGLSASTKLIDARIDGTYAGIASTSPLNPVHQVSLFPGVHNWTWSENDATNVWYHTNEAHDYFVGSPFNYSTMNYKMIAHVGHNSSVGAESVNGTSMAFGTYQGENAKIRDVIYHEYTHAVIYRLYGNKNIRVFAGAAFNSQADAMDEGLSDYFASSMTNDEKHGETLDYVRHMDNSRTWNPSEVAHINGEVIGGACWDLRETSLSDSYVDELVFDALQMTPHATDFEEFAINIAIADDNDGDLTTGVPNYSKIKTAFETNHGISFVLPPAIPQNLAYTDVGGFPKLTWNAANHATSYQVWRKKNSGSFAPIATPTSNSYTDTEIGLGGQGDTYYYKLKSSNLYGTSGFSSEISLEGTEFEKSSSDNLLPKSFSLEQNYPNPFNPTTTIKYQLPKAANVSLKIYTVSGQLVATLVDENKSAGFHSVNFNAAKLASGTYIYKITAGNFAETKKMILIK